MRKKILRVKVEILNENGEYICGQQIKECSFSKPTTAMEVGLSLEEQLAIMANIQQSVLDNQADFLK